MFLHYKSFARLFEDPASETSKIGLLCYCGIATPEEREQLRAIVLPAIERDQLAMVMTVEDRRKERVDNWRQRAMLRRKEGKFDSAHYSELRADAIERKYFESECLPYRGYTYD